MQIPSHGANAAREVFVVPFLGSAGAILSPAVPLTPTLAAS